MTDIRTFAFPKLKWLPDQDHSIPTAVSDWLIESGSMTRRFERYCSSVHAEPQRECFITRNELEEEADHLSNSSRYWLREIVLIGDNKPWLLGRTVIPQETLDHNQTLMHLGNVLLGRYLFSSNELTRDYIHIGQQGRLWARRSRLHLEGKPLLITEIF
ncbi:putative chorismate--pyruvate lyase (CL) (CPL) [Bartonella clarridgeiae 73]|uniref:Probable chorismate pyruvate-lyase n=1 Tax=Bartonella clarridgeiae (strain CCUG 45776 / CIP 104772 / 73) TaxID=696125 RepID=E6YGP2_BARC7|nr:chorismate lyase [Bartonella clarridgeiae]WCR55376.1 MAG: Chorismate--pyruvate lyase [Bartonella clarridgeiae]CBI76030.1 putative chorismate--pyruvate lyase (CL) (CPL) [Bartonella clarridgeiae 73]